MDELTASYLARLGLEPEPPSLDALQRLHRAQVERVPYETMWIHAGESWGIDPRDVDGSASPSKVAAATASTSTARSASCSRRWATRSPVTSAACTGPRGPTSRC